MSRFDITRILAPAAIKPRTNGPRDTGAPPAPTIHATLQPEKVHPMPRHSPQQAVLDALRKNSPQSHTDLMAATDLDTNQVSNAIYNLKKNNAIIKSGKFFGIPGCTFPLGSPPAEKPTPAPKASRLIPTFKQSIEALTDEPMPPYRALRLAGGGAIILIDSFSSRELTAAQFAAVENLVLNEAR